MNVQDIFKNNEEWVSKKLDLNANYFKELAKGQAPEFLYIGCSDSRVTAESMMGAEPGDVFVHRNVANVVSNLDVSARSVINYAVQHLGVNHIVVCGHYECGGVKAAMGDADLGIINPWLQNIRDVYRLHQTELDGISNESDRYKRLVELNVLEQCMNMMNNADVQKGIESRGLQVHGWVFDIASGKIIDLGFDLASENAKIGDAYKVIK